VSPGATFHNTKMHQEIAHIWKF